MNGFSIALLLALSVGTIDALLTKKDLYNALSTPRRIFAVQRTFERSGDKGKHTCVYAIQTHLQDDDYQFEQHYKEGPIGRANYLYGKLSDGHKGPVLTVSYEQGREGTPYTLLYWDPRRHCAILEFLEKGETRCELHVWEDDFLASTSTPCDHEYERYCGPVKYEVSQRTCLRN
uniref:Lipocalin-2 1 n=1 Tax=Amblyomma cajennense TaxID=34607 RepID=A0A023FTQ1_AMBCJ